MLRGHKVGKFRQKNRCSLGVRNCHFRVASVQAEYSSFQIDDFVAEVIEPLRVSAKEKGVTLRTGFGTTEPIVRSDHQLPVPDIVSITLPRLGSGVRIASPAPNSAKAIRVYRTRKLRLLLPIDSSILDGSEMEAVDAKSPDTLA
jgi:hypothetical protein